MKTILILPYFGKFPNYFDLHLHTIGFNPDFDWLILTDDKTPMNFPKNVTVVYIPFEEVQQHVKSKFDFEINMERAHKLCDFKPAFGQLFEKYIQGYDYWGHCDPDIIWGNFNHFIDFDQMAKFDKIFLLGHLSLYRNNTENNLRYLKDIDGHSRYREVFSNPIGYLFDEKWYKSINTIFRDNDYPLYTGNFPADIDTYHTNLRLSIFDVATGNYFLDKVKKQIFVWDNGNTYRYYIQDKKLVKEEFLYVHLQKRKMTNNLPDFPSRFVIAPKSFEPLDEEITLENFHKHYKSYWFNSQFFQVKYNSLKYKLKYRKYFYGL